jgi:host factor-I protein
VGPKKDSIQDKFLADLKEQGSLISIYLVNGIKLTGILAGFDQYCLMLKGPEKSHEATQMSQQNEFLNVQVIYKNAISTVVPGGQTKNDVEKGLKS